MTLRRQKLRGILFACVCSALSAAFIYVTYIVAADERQIISGQVQRLLVEDSNAPANQNLSSKVLARSPMDPVLLNAWLVSTSATSDERPDVKIVERFKLLGKLGYRHSPAQFNLMYLSLLEQDYAGLAGRIDGMYRRGEQTPELLGLLANIETDANLRPELIAVLRRDPPWARQYLFSEDVLQISGVLDARVDTLAALGKTDVPLRSAYAFASRKAWHSREAAIAQNLWEAGNQLPRNDGDMPFPFEWTVLNNPDFDGDLVRDDGGATIRLNWNGRKTAGFVGRSFLLRDNRRPEIVIENLVGIAPDLLAFKVKCSGTGWRTANADRSRKGIVFTLSNDLPCKTGEIVIAPRKPMQGGTSFGFQIIENSFGPAG